jgi:hypothetical protein
MYLTKEKMQKINKNTRKIKQNEEINSIFFKQRGNGNYQ